MIYDHSKINDGDGTVLDISDLLRTKVRSTRSGTRPPSWCRSSQMKSCLGNCTSAGARNLTSSKQLVAWYIQDTVRKSGHKNHTKQKSTVTRHLNKRLERNISLLLNDLVIKQASNLVLKDSRCGALQHIVGYRKTVSCGLHRSPRREP